MFARCSTNVCGGGNEERAEKHERLEPSRFGPLFIPHQLVGECVKLVPHVIFGFFTCNQPLFELSLPVCLVDRNSVSVEACGIVTFSGPSSKKSVTNTITGRTTMQALRIEQCHITLPHDILDNIRFFESFYECILAIGIVKFVRLLFRSLDQSPHIRQILQGFGG